jgi:hypothetical protein
LWLFVVAGHAAAAPPVLDFVFPAGGQRGTTTAITAAGKFDPWPAQIWIDCPGVEFKPESAAGKFAVKIAADAPLGPHLIRLHSAEGVSVPRCFIVGGIPEQLEKEPNDSAKQAQPLDKLPVTINGRLEKSGDVDSYAVKLAAGHWLVAAVDGYSLGSPIDPILHLLDEHGNKLAFNNDTHNLDPRLAYRIEKSGTYIIQIAAFAYPPAADVRFTGSASSVYRLTLTDGPFVQYAFPAGVPRGGKTAVQLFGWNLAQSQIEQADATALPKQNDRLQITGPGLENVLHLAVGDSPELIETEPNDKPDKAQPVSVPCTINGRIEPAGDQDRFIFSAKKEERFIFRVDSAKLHFPLDAVLKVEDSAGKQLAQNDDGNGGADPQLAWTAPADGQFIVAITDITHTGGPDFVYRLEITRPTPDFKAVADNHFYRIEPGKTAEIKLTLTRLNGFEGKLSVSVDNLPPGITAPAVEIPAKANEAKLILTAAADTKPASQPIRVMVSAAEKTIPQRTATFNLKPPNPGAGDLLINQTDRLWLIVAPK